MELITTGVRERQVETSTTGHHIEARSSLVVSNTGLVISNCTTKQLNQRDEKPLRSGESVLQYGNADVMELVYVLVLEAKFCEFESHHPHQQF